MALNLLSSLLINGVKLVFGTNPEAEKFSLSVAIPAWPVEETKGKGKNKVVTGIVDASFSKRSINDVGEFMSPKMPVEFLEGAIDRNLPGFRAFWRKNGIENTVTDGATTVHQGLDGAYKGIQSVKEIIAIISSTMERLTPKSASGSVADPELEAKRIFSKSSEYISLNFNDPASVFSAWEKTQLENIARVMEKAGKISAEDHKSFCLSKFTDNGVDEDGYLRLKAEKKVTV